jgi:acyl-CoA thioesterase
MGSDRLHFSAPLDAQFILDGGSGRYKRTIHANWCNFDERVFGGYTAALCFAAAARESVHPALASGHVVFLDAVCPETIEFEVTILRRGRSLTAVRVDALQRGKPVVACQAWLRAAPSEPAPVGHTDAIQGLATTVDLAWLASDLGFHGWLESRGVDYPRNWQEFAQDRQRSVDLWVQPRPGLLASGVMTQLFDILVADAFIADSHLRGQACNPADLVSLDLGIQWTPLTHRTGWRRIRAESPPVTDGSAACVATLEDETGSVCATATQQAWIRQRQ